MVPPASRQPRLQALRMGAQILLPEIAHVGPRHFGFRRGSPHADVRCATISFSPCGRVTSAKLQDADLDEARYVVSRC